MTILCATHFTDSSMSAVKVAGALARKHREKLFLVNVQPPGPVGHAFEVSALDALKLEAAAFRNDGVDVAVEVLRGPLAATVWRFCVAQGATFMVVGDTNHLTSALFESSLDQFAHGIDIPLLVVRDEEPLLSWVQGKAPLRAMLALDQTWTSLAARQWVTRLAQYGALDLVASHIWWPASEYERRGLPAPTPADCHEALEQLIRAEVEEGLRELPRNVKPTVHLEIGLEHVADRLLEQSVAEQVDLFIVGTHPHGGPLTRLWSISRDVLGLAPMSVVCVPVPRRPAATLPQALPQAIGVERASMRYNVPRSTPST